MLVYPDGTYVQYSLDNLNRVYSAGLNGTTNVLFGQVFDGLGRRKSSTRGVSSLGGATTYGYDSLGRISSFTNDLASTPYDITWTFAYSAANQITSWGASTAMYDYGDSVTATTAKSYDGLNRDSTIAALTGGYDTKGNLTYDGTRTMSYDIYNRLISTTGAGINVRLVYDTEGRLSKYSVDGGTTYTTFLYDGTNLIGEYNNSGTLTERYIHGTGTDEPIVWYHGTGLTASDQRFFYQNYQGSVIAYTDSTGTMVNFYKYGPYGEPMNSSNTASWSGPRFRYTGQTALFDVSLYYYKARVYDPTFGRFLQTDPVGSGDDLDLYAYTGDDPIDGSDPTGEYAENCYAQTARDGTIGSYQCYGSDDGNKNTTINFYVDNAHVGTVVVQGDISKDGGARAEARFTIEKFYNSVNFYDRGTQSSQGNNGRGDRTGNPRTPYQTDGQAAQDAQSNGWRATNYTSKGSRVWQDRDGNFWTRDKPRIQGGDSDNGGAWKKASRPDGFGPNDRLGTYDRNLTRIGK